MKKIYSVTIIAVFLAIIFLVPILTKIETPVAYSPYENRNMAKPPVFSIDGLFSGEYLPLWDEYFSDHIWKRTDIFRMYNYLEIKILKKPVVNEVVVQSNILLPFTEFSDAEYDYTEESADMSDKLSLLNTLVKEYGGEFIYIGIPAQRSMLRDYYPSYLENSDQSLSLMESQFFSQLEQHDISYINMRQEFLAAGDYMRFYPATDHHYNFFGAFFTYTTLMDKLQGYVDDIPVLTENEIEFVKLENPFIGSRLRKLYDIYESDERLYYYTLSEPVPFTRYNNGVQVESTVFTLPSDKVTAVTYDIYMGGDIAETIIKTERENLPNALIFGDSFTNPLETFLYYSFNETVTLDLRQYSKQTILEYIENYKPDFVFCLRDDTAYLNPEGNGNIK